MLWLIYNIALLLLIFTSFIQYMIKVNFHYPTPSYNLEID